MNIRKLMLPAVIAGLIAAPAAFAQSADVNAQAEVDAQAQVEQAEVEQAATTAGDVVGDASARLSPLQRRQLAPLTPSR